jgi:hypothetical protein
MDDESKSCGSTPRGTDTTQQCNMLVGRDFDVLWSLHCLARFDGNHTSPNLTRHYLGRSTGLFGSIPVIGMLLGYQHGKGVTQAVGRRRRRKNPIRGSATARRVTSRNGSRQRQWP